MKKYIIVQFLLAFAFIMQANAASSVDPDAPIYAVIGPIQVQYLTENCGVRNISIAGSLEYYGSEKVAVVESFLPKINSELFLYLSDYVAKRAGKEINNRSVLKIIKGTADKLLGKDYISEALIAGILQN